MTYSILGLESPETFIRSQAGYVYSVVAIAVMWPLAKLAATVKA